jgi:hypothetical protein
VSIGVLVLAVALSSYLFAPVSVGALPPRPTPAITPTATPTRTSPPRAPKQTSVHERLSHIRLVVTPAQDGLWSVVEWQGVDGVWHIVEGWQGAIEGGSKRWAVYERNFGDGPFRWVVTSTFDGETVGISTPFKLPDNEGVELLIRVELTSDRSFNAKSI